MREDAATGGVGGWRAVDFVFAVQDRPPAGDAGNRGARAGAGRVSRSDSQANGGTTPQLAGWHVGYGSAPPTGCVGTHAATRVHERFIRGRTRDHAKEAGVET